MFKISWKDEAVNEHCKENKESLDFTNNVVKQKPANAGHVLRFQWFKCFSTVGREIRRRKSRRKT